MKTLCMVAVVVLGLSGLLFGAPLFYDSFDSSEWTGWNVGFAGTGSVTNGGGYAELYEEYPTWGYSSLSTQDTFTIGQGLEVDVTMMFTQYNPGYTPYFIYCPNMTLQDADGVAHVGIYSPFTFGATSAPLVMQTLNSGTMADTHSTPVVGTSGWSRFYMNVYTDHATIQIYDNENHFVDEWTATYDPMDSIRVCFSADCPGWWPPAKLLVDLVQIQPVSVSPPVVAATIPAGSVTVDGNLSDWSDASWTPLNQDYNGAATDISEAAYAVKWSADKIYVAVKVHDTAHTFTDSYVDWNARDAVEVYLHTASGGPGNFPRCEVAQQYTLGIRNDDPTQVWAALGNNAMYPNMLPVSIDSDYLTARGHEEGEWLIYEAALTPYEFLGVVNSLPSVISPLQASDLIGFDVCVVSNNGSTYTGMKSANMKTGKSGNWKQFDLQKLITRPGDANLDDKVDVSDLGILAANYGTTAGASWETGDFNNDGKVDVSDLGILAANYGTGTGVTLDFNQDAKTLGLSLDEPQKKEAPAISLLGCGSAGLPLSAGLLLALLGLGCKMKK